MPEFQKAAILSNDKRIAFYAGHQDYYAYHGGGYDNLTLENIALAKGADLLERVVQPGGRRARIGDQGDDPLAVGLDAGVGGRKPVGKDDAPFVYLQRVDGPMPQAHNAGRAGDRVVGLGWREQG